MSLATRKDQARERAKALRAELRANPRDFVRSWPALEPSAIVAGYWPIGTEADVRPLLHKLAASHTVVLPVTSRDRRRLSFRRWTPDGEMETGPFGTRHPVGEMGHGEDPLTPTVVMVPLLAFTKDGDRLGYGGGYYDATLTALKVDNPALRAVGIAFSGQKVPTLPVEETDVRLDHILTEKTFMTTRL